jgi:hypothetical protein
MEYDMNKLCKSAETDMLQGGTPYQAEEALRQKAEAFRASNVELELFNSTMVGRELHMIELKQEINELCCRLGEPPRHATGPALLKRQANG